MVDISQRSSFSEGFGDVLRSSAIFYVRQSGGMITTISFMDYWKAKRGLTVAIVATVRAMDGRLIKRDRLRFVEGEVINYRPDLDGEGEGSVEIEILSTENLVFPYPAVMALYESENTVSMVHSYARAYSRHEVEEGKTVTRGEESNWTMRDTKSVRSFCVFHNGGGEQEAQTARLTVISSSGEKREAEIPVDRLRPYESFRLVPSGHISGLAEFLGGKPGQGTLSFNLNQSFTRMLVANETTDGRDLQVTHSDFNFNIHQTDRVGGADIRGLLRMPLLHEMERWVVVYPEQDPGRYTVAGGSGAVEFASGESLTINAGAEDGLFVFEKADGPLPTRINTGIGCSASPDFLPAEPSLGIMHDEVPPKRMTWGPCALNDDLQTNIVVHAYDAIFGPPPADMELSFRLYSAFENEFSERTIAAPDLAAFDNGIPLEEIFPEAKSFLGGEYGYFTMYTEYGGLKAYVLMRKPSGSVTLEHCF